MYSKLSVFPLPYNILSIMTEPRDEYIYIYIPRLVQNKVHYAVDALLKVFQETLRFLLVSTG